MNIQFDTLLKNALVETVLDEYEDAIGGKIGVIGRSDVGAHAHNDNEHMEGLTGNTAEETVFEDFAELLRAKRDTASNFFKQGSEEDLSTDEGKL